ncbi:MAG: DUF2842 domain-containing protein [Oceanibaculum sp.]
MASVARWQDKPLGETASAAYLPGMSRDFLPFRWRSTVAVLLIMVGLVVYSLLAMVVGTYFLPDHWAAELSFYLVAGIAWVWPSAKLIGWAAKTDAKPLQ